jgi:hypothetical protein
MGYIFLGLLVLGLVYYFMQNQANEVVDYHNDSVNLDNNDIEITDGLTGSFEVVGVHIASRKDYIINNCEEYESVELFFDINNKYSDQAIAVQHEETVIGYIKEEDCSVVREFMNHPEGYNAFISALSVSDSYLHVEIHINT